MRSVTKHTLMVGETPGLEQESLELVKSVVGIKVIGNININL